MVEHIKEYPIVSENLSFIYKESEVKAINKISLKIEQGKFILLCGPTGSGKTSFLRTINGLIPYFFKGKFYGYMKIKGKDTIEAKSPAKLSEYCGTVYQNPENQLFSMNVKSELLFSLEQFGCSKEEMETRLNSVIELMEISSLLDKSPFELSGGEKQKVAIASLLSLEPDILLLDEPLSNLDPQTARNIVQILIKLKEEDNKTIIVSEHRIEYIIDHIDEIILIDKGKLIFHDSADEVLMDETFFHYGLDLPPLLYWYHDLKIHKKQDLTKPISLRGRDQRQIFNEVLKEELKSIDINTISHSILLNNNISPAQSQNTKKAPHLIVENLNFSYKKENPILQDVSFSINKGEIIAIVGGNGVGKSTLLKCIMGLLRPNEGDIYINGNNIKNTPVYEIAETVGIMFQNAEHQLFSHTIRKELEFSLNSLKIDDVEREERINSILKRFKLSELSETSPFNISEGQKKAVSLASTLCRLPEILIFDEPTIGQDKNQKQLIVDIIREENQKNKIIILVSHDTDFIMNLATRIIVLKEGQIFCDGIPGDIMNNPHILNIASLTPLLEIQYLEEARKNIEKLKLLPKSIISIRNLRKWIAKVKEITE